MSTARHRRPPTPVLTPQRAALGALAATGAGAALPLAAAATPAAAAAPARAAHAAPAHPAAAPISAPATGTVHVVRTGENLTEIAGALSVRGGWPSIYEQNRTVIGPDPNLIRPGERLRIPMSRATAAPRPVRTAPAPVPPGSTAAPAPTRAPAPTQTPAPTRTFAPAPQAAPTRTSAPVPTPTRARPQPPAPVPTHAPAQAPAPSYPPAPSYAPPPAPTQQPTASAPQQQSTPSPTSTPPATATPPPATPQPPSTPAAIWYTAPDGTRRSTTVLPSAANPQRVFYYVSTPPDPAGPLRVADIPVGGGKDGYGVSWQLAPSGETYQPEVGVYSQGPFGLLGHASYIVGLAHDQQVSLNWTSAANLTSP